MEGSVVSMRSLESETGGNVFLWVSLPDGREVRVDPNRGMAARVGKRIWLRELKDESGAVFSFRVERVE